MIIVDCSFVNGIHFKSGKKFKVQLGGKDQTWPTGNTLFLMLSLALMNQGYGING